MIASLRVADRYEHGTRARYNTGCHCFQCRRANARYESERAKRPPNPYVSVAPVRDHLDKLTAQGVGLRTVAEMAGASRSTLREIRIGAHNSIRKQLADRILAVGIEHAAEGALVDGAETWALIDELLAAGYRKGQIATMLGREVPALQLKRGMVRASTADAVKSLHAELMAEGEGESEDDKPKARILRALRRFDWVGAEALNLAIGFELEERDAFTKALERLVRAGDVERRGDRPFEYRLAVKS